MNTKSLTLGTLTVAAALALAAGIQAQQVRDQTAAPPRAGAPAQTGTAAISGSVVTNEQTPQPIRRGMVTVSSMDAPVNRSAFTDDAGRFSVAGLPAGRYTLAATKAPYLRSAYGAKRPDGAGTPITLKDGHQMTDIVLRMTRGSVLAGRITDENGEPAFGVSVRVLQLRMQFGERTFVPVAGAGSTTEITDDRGMFRVFGLPPGEYALSASPRVVAGEVRAMTEAEIRAVMQALAEQQTARQAAQQGQPAGQKPPAAGAPGQSGAATTSPTPDVDKVTVAYAPVYYPGTTSAATASTVTIGPGEERTGVDFPLRLVRTTTLEGLVVTPAGIPPQSVQLMMMPTTSTVGLAGLEALALQRIAVGPDGKFLYTAVAPGQYTISARATRPSAGAPGQPPPPPPPPGSAQSMTFSTRVVTAGGGAGEAMMVMPDMVMGGGDPNGTQYWAMAEVSVDGTPVGGVTLALQPGMSVSGKVEFRSAMTRPGGDLKRTRLNLNAVATGGGLRISTSSPLVQIDENGQFTITGVTPGRYRLSGNAPILQGSGPGPAWVLASAVVKGRDILDFPFDVGPGENITDAVVTFTDATQDVGGTLQDASGRPAPDYTIVVFAADNRYWVAGSRRIRTTRPGTDGKFSITNLPPGDYRIAAVVDVMPNEVNDPAFLEQLVGASVAFPLKIGEKKTQDLKIAGGL